MPEPIRTEDVPATPFFNDQKERPFVDKHPREANLAIEIEKGKRSHSEKFERINEKHGRNMTETTSSKKVVWGGTEPGDIYGAKSIKGTAMYQGISINIGENDNGSLEIKPVGLMDDHVVTRIKSISLFMRKNGLPTERVRSVKKLEFVFLKDNDKWKKIPVSEWEQQILKDASEKVGDSRDYGTRKKAEFIFDSLKYYLERTNFIALERDVQVDERLADLKEAIFKGNLKDFIKPIFRWLNAAMYARNGGLVSGTPRAPDFRPTDSDINRYISDFLPTQMGTFLGRFHHIGLNHRYLHDQNWTAVGTVLDLDSADGSTAIYNDPVNRDYDFAKDLAETVKQLHSLSDVYARHNNLDTSKFYSEILYKFLRSYFSERKIKDLKSIDLTKYEDIFNNSFGKSVLERIINDGTIRN